MIVNCMLCKKEYDIDQGDPQYRKLIAKETKYYICKSCNAQSKKDAMTASGIDPDSIDPDRYDKFVP